MNESEIDQLKLNLELLSELVSKLRYINRELRHVLRAE